MILFLRGEFMNYLKIILGNIFMTFAYAYIAVPFGIVNGGVTSFAMVLDKNLPGNISFWTNTLYLSLLIIYYIFYNITTLYFICIFSFDWKFFRYTTSIPFILYIYVTDIYCPVSFFCQIIC